MTNQSEEVNSWEQLQLIPPRAVELTLRVGIASEDDHVQFQLEVREAGTQALLELSSRPHVFALGAVVEIERWLDATRDALYRHLDPF